MSFGYILAQSYAHVNTYIIHAARRKKYSGKRQLPLDALITLARFYGTSTDYILGLTEERQPYRK